MPGEPSAERYSPRQPAGVRHRFDVQRRGATLCRGQSDLGTAVKPWRYSSIVRGRPIAELIGKLIAPQVATFRAGRGASPP